MEYIFWEHDDMSDKKSGMNMDKSIKQTNKQTKTIMATPKPPQKGFDTRSYSRATKAAVKDFKNSTKVVKISAIQDKDQRSSNEYNKRVPIGGKNSAKSMTYGTSKNNKGTTTYTKGKAK
jgi:hypothetical protein